MQIGKKNTYYDYKLSHNQNVHTVDSKIIYCDLNLTSFLPQLGLISTEPFWKPLIPVTALHHYFPFLPTRWALTRYLFLLLNPVFMFIHTNPYLMILSFISYFQNTWLIQVSSFQGWSNYLIDSVKYKAQI